MNKVLVNTVQTMKKYEIEYLKITSKNLSTSQSIVNSLHA